MRQTMGIATALLPLLLSAAASDTLRLECEDFAGPWRVQANIEGYSARGFVVSNAPGIATTSMAMSVDVTAAGRYFIWARGYEGSGADRRWRVRVGGTLLAITHGDRAARGFSWQRCGDVELQPGTVEVLILDAGESYEVADAVMLTTDPNLDPAEEDRRWLVLDPDEARRMVFNEIMARTRAHAAAVPVCGTLGEWHARAAEIRPRILSALGLDPLPERTPLNVNLLGETQLDGYRIQRLTFESRPGFVVTANVYVPDGPGPFPLVLCPVGHWRHGKDEQTPAARSHGLAKLGYVTITYDPFGQEERAVPGNEHSEHWRLSLTGHSNMSLMVWDTVRALDYMLTRPDVDPDRIACTGASGGGLNTLYYSIVDDRLDVAVPVVYITQWADFLGTGAQHCPCSHVPGLGAFTDMGEMTALFAPRPQMYINALADPQFLTAGAQHAEAQARVVYDLFSAGDRLRLRCFPGDHDYGKAMRETVYGFLEQHLRGQGDGTPVTESSFTPLEPDSPVIRCFESGHVPETATTARQLALTWAQEAAARLPGPDALKPSALRTALKTALNPPAPFQPSFEVAGQAEHHGLRVTMLRLTTQQGITLPAYLVPSGRIGPGIVIVGTSDTPMAALDLAVAAHTLGVTALCLSPRGHGETAFDEHVICTDNMLLGDPILGQRAFDVAQAIRALCQMPDVAGQPVGLVGDGPSAGLYVLFAQALWPEAGAVAAGPVPSSYFEAFGPGVPMAAYVSGILRVADIPHVAALAAEHPLALSVSGDSLAQRYPEWAQKLERDQVLRQPSDPSAMVRWVCGQLVP